MKTDRITIVSMVVLAISFLMLAGCGEKGTTPEDMPGRKYMVARIVQDGAPKYFEYQQRCPVCDGTGLLAEQYVDVDGKRIYFDAKACKEAFQKDQSKFLGKLDERKEKWDSTH